MNLVTVMRQANVMLAFIWLGVYFTSLKDSIINALSFYVSFEYLRELPVLRFIYIFLIFVFFSWELGYKHIKAPFLLYTYLSTSLSELSRGYEE